MLSHSLSHLALPFFDDQHREHAAKLCKWVSEQSITAEGEASRTHDDTTISWVRALGEAGWLKNAVAQQNEGVYQAPDLRTLCLTREIMAFESGLADFSFAMQGLGAGPVSLFGSDALRNKYLPDVSNGLRIPAFAISEKQAGSDVGAMSTVARRDPDNEGYLVINGEKSWISNAGIADFYSVFCRFEDSVEDSRKPSGDAIGKTSASPSGNVTPSGYVAVVIPKDTQGFSVSERIETISPHPLGTIRFVNCRVPVTNIIGEAGRGMRVALGTLDMFRTTVAAAALGFAKRAFQEAVAYSLVRDAYGSRISEFQLIKAKIAEMAAAISSSELLIYKAAWTKDNGAERITREAALAKWQSTERAQMVIDSAVQIMGGKGVVAGSVTERLYRDIRALRIYEGTSEIQQLIIADHVLAEYKDPKMHRRC